MTFREAGACDVAGVTGNKFMSRMHECINNIKIGTHSVHVGSHKKINELS